MLEEMSAAYQARMEWASSTCNTMRLNTVRLNAVTPDPIEFSKVQAYGNHCAEQVSIIDTELQYRKAANGLLEPIKDVGE